MQPLLERLNKGEVVICDGAMGTMLFQRGLKPGDCPEILNLTNPGILREIAREYFEAGASIITSNTFGASPLKLADYGLEDKTEEINKAGAEIVRDVAGDNAYVGGDCGPTGKLLVPFGDTDPAEIYEGFERQINSLVNAKVDLILIETMTDLQEAMLAVKAAKNISSDIPVAVTLTFDETPRGFFTIMGNSIEDAVKGLSGAGADIIGSNCGNGLMNMIKIAKEFKKYSSIPILIQSNAGIPESKEGKLWFPESSEFFREKIPQLLEAGVSVIGGCCGTTPEYIRAIKQKIFPDRN